MLLSCQQFQRNVCLPPSNWVRVALFVLLAPFAVTLASQAATVTATFNSATDVPISANGYTATGNTINFSLNFAPPTGTMLTVVNNTGLAFISGVFTNLAQGQAVTLAYNGANYFFVANYYGGTGNDLVLLWADTKLMAWGNNTKGQLGLNTSTTTLIPTNVRTDGALSGKVVRQVSVGDQHCLAVCTDGTVVAWGYNAEGELGIGNTAESSVPVAIDRSGVLAGKTVVAVAAGAQHSLALCSDGTVAAWGSNASGQLGNSSTTDSLVPVLVGTTGTALEGRQVAGISAGDYHSLVFCTDGSAVSWGNNTSGQLGDNTAPAQSNKPVFVATVGTALEGKMVVAAAASRYHNLVLCSDGTMAAWGNNQSGQLGNNSTVSSNVPVAVVTTGTLLAGKSIVSVVVGVSHSMALCADGTLATWGSNTLSQLGSTGGSKSVPSAVNVAGVLASRTVSSIAAGGSFSQAVCTDGSLVMWGDNQYGQLGSNNFTSYSVPVLVSATGNALAGKTVVAASCGSGRSLALSSDGTLAAWGLNAHGQLGTGGSTFTASPTDVTTSGVLAGKTVIAAKSGYDFSVALCSDGTLASWGANDASQLGLGNSSVTKSFVPVAVSNTGALSGVKVVAIACGEKHTLALSTSGTVVAWGFGSYGQLGAGNTLSTSTAVSVSRTGGLSGKTVVAVAAGDLFSVALCSDGTVAAWGDNSLGQLGNNSTTSTTTPVAVDRSGVLAGKTVIAIACGTLHTLALCSDGTVAAWGSNDSGVLGNNSLTFSRVPVLVSQVGVLAGKTVTAVSAGQSRSMALCSDGTLTAWGTAETGSSTTRFSRVPVDITGSGVLAGRTPVALAQNTIQSLALCSDGNLSAWGYAELGPGATFVNQSSVVPTAVGSGSLAAGERFIGVFSGPTASHVLGIAAKPLSFAAKSLAATAVSSNSAILNGLVTPGGLATAVSFDYGTSATYGTTQQGSPATTPATFAPTAVNALLTGLNKLLGVRWLWLLVHHSEEC